MAEPDSRHQAALDRFLEARPELQTELDTLNPLAARAAGLSVTEYRAERLHEAFEEFADAQGMFAWELTLQLTAATPQEFETQRLEVHKEVAEMAGMPWDEYMQLNGLKES
ncbi:MULTISPECIES: DUF6388 family protein [unclassified Pseudomonas]|uniref:DUF6388 family protein n=1 Tax=unclassified Pseudomonas TaxID=196821 RepID=UPI0017835AA0|nr:MULTISPECIES: DUF6388 family protein [unclassified Pseudomonas]MBD8601531.1 DNA repair protein [Pseudomonas sp. CFBP 8771]MBD8621640.1 DNA repair protein [Pseudomonas sp. CFBP 13727]MBD8729715.1 DNA repair protein [Pseudomonas sp. CFBP 13710]